MNINCSVSGPSVVHGGGSCPSKAPPKQPFSAPFSGGDPFRQDNRTVDVHPPHWSSPPRPIGPSITPQENSPLAWSSAFLATLTQLRLDQIPSTMQSCSWALDYL